MFNYQEDLSEVVGVILGDGCLSKYWSNSENIWRYELAFTGSSSEYTYYENFVQPTIKKYFGISGRLFLRKDNSTRYHIKSRKVCEFFHSIGIPYGKKSNNLSICDGILSKDDLAIACIRGIWNTDGSIYRRYNKKYGNHKRVYNHLVMQLKMGSKLLITQVKKVLETVGIESNKIIPESNTFVLRITQQEAISTYLSNIGFSNIHHINRLKALNK